MMKRYLWLMLLMAGAANASPIALVTDLVGSGQQGEGEMARELQILDELDAGSVVSVEADGRLGVVYLDSGQEYTYQGPAQVYFREDQPVSLSGEGPEVLALLDEGDASLMGSVGVAQAAMVMRSAGAADGTVQLLSPVNTRVLAARPVFRWTPVVDAQAYQLNLEDASEQSVWSARVEVTRVELPGSVHLVPGARYTWKVEALMEEGQGPGAWANFRVSGQDLRQEVAARQPAADASFSKRLLFAIWLQDQGLREEAQPYWDQLSEERPDSRSLQALAGS